MKIFIPCIPPKGVCLLSCKALIHKLSQTKIYNVRKVAKYSKKIQRHSKTVAIWTVRMKSWSASMISLLLLTARFVVMIFHVALISNDTFNSFIWYLSFCFVIHIAGLPLWRPSLPLLEGSLCLFGMIWCYSTKCMFEVANKYEQIHYYLTWHDTVI